MKKSDNIWAKAITMIILFVTSIAIIGIEVGNKVIDERTVIATVTDKQVKRTGDSSSDKYLIYTENENGNVAVYEITDSLLKGRFNSSDLYATIKIGKTYRLTICGERYPILSMYPNIYSAIEITNNTDSE